MPPASALWPGSRGHSKWQNCSCICKHSCYSPLQAEKLRAGAHREKTLKEAQGGQTSQYPPGDTWAREGTDFPASSMVQRGSAFVQVLRVAASPSISLQMTALAVWPCVGRGPMWWPSAPAWASWTGRRRRCSGQPGWTRTSLTTGSMMARWTLLDGLWQVGFQTDSRVLSVPQWSVSTRCCLVSTVLSR